MKQFKSEQNALNFCTSLLSQLKIKIFFFSKENNNDLIAQEIVNIFYQKLMHLFEFFSTHLEIPIMIFAKDRFNDLIDQLSPVKIIMFSSNKN